MLPKEKLRISVHVNPNAGQNKVVGFQDGLLKGMIAVPPTKGKANQELIALKSGGAE